MKAQFTPLSYWQWAFGANVGMDINGAQINWYSNNMSTQEGCASFSDVNGDLMLYTDGAIVWKVQSAVNFVCPTLLNGSPNNGLGSAAQGVFILPRPGVANQLFIFTVSDANAANPINHGLTCYTYDWNTNTITNTFQPLINSFCTEAITAIPHCNGTDFWIVVKPIINPTQVTAPSQTLVANNATGAQNNCLYSYLVTNAGMSNTPVVSNFGATAAFTPSLSGIPLNWVCTLKASPDRKFLALGERDVNGTAGALNLYQFDCGSGTFNFANRQAQTYIAYGVSFNQTSTFVYTSNGSDIRRYDIRNVTTSLSCGGAVTSLPITDFATQFYSNNAIYQLQLTEQLGNFPGCILAATNGNTINRLNVPDNIINPNFTANAFGLQAGTLCRAGLPNNMDADVPTSVAPLTCSVCPNNCSNTFCFDVSGCINGSITWNFGDNTIISGTGYNPVTSTPNTSGTFLNPCHTYTATGIYTVAVTSLSQTCTQTIMVSTNWDITTKNSNKNDQGNDIIVDANENVYVAGTFEMNTTFTTPCGNITIPGGGMPGTSAYIAKFDKCSNLLWINYENSPLNSTGMGIALDPITNQVYMSGIGAGGGLLNFQSNAERPCISAASAPSAFSAAQYYVAKFNATTGAYISEYSGALPGLISIKPGVFVDVQSTGANTGVYVTGSYFNGTTDVVFVQKLNSALTVQQWMNFSQPTLVGGIETVQDIAYSPSSDNIFITGTYAGDIKFGTTIISTPASTDAFVWGFTGATGVVTGANDLGNLGAYNASGTSLITNGSSVYCTGVFNNNIGSVFGSAFSFPGGPVNKLRSYVVAFNSNALSPTSVINAVEIKSNINLGDVKTTGIGISTASGQLVVTGTYNNSVNSPAFVSNNAAYANSTGNKMFEAAFLISGLVPQWCIGTNDNNTPNSVHFSTKIAALGAHCYATGGYINNMSYNLGMPASGPLNATFIGSRNTYVVRNDLSASGTFFKTAAGETTTSILEFDYDMKNAITVFPNPNKGVFTIQSLVSFTNSTILINDVMGKCVYKKQYASLQNEEINISHLNNGIYFIHLTNAEGAHEVRKIVKE
ncbi:MAG: T9SS type A sorting domain-containing protein [Bacteroidia bacterium]